MSILLRAPSPKSRTLWKQLDDYQKEAVDFAWKAKTAALFFEQGTGKTWISLGLLERLVNSSANASSVFVVPLANIDSTWKKTINEQLPGVYVARSLDDYVGWKKAWAGPIILLLHYEAVPRIIKKLRKHQFDLIVYDESQRLKQRSSLTSRTAAKLRNNAPRKLILSGTPIDEQPSDLWAQFRFLRPNVFGTVWAEFEEEYMEPIPERLMKSLKKHPRGSMLYQRAFKMLMIAKSKRSFDFDNKLDGFLHRLKPWAMRITKDVLNLPPVEYVEEVVTLRGEQRILYETIRDDLVASLSGGSFVMAPLKVTQMVKLQQVCGGFIIDDNGETHFIGRTKLRRIKTIVEREQNRGPIVIFARYLAEIEMIRDALSSPNHGRIVKVLSGRTPKKDRGALVGQFQRGEIDVLVCQIKTGGVGIDLYRSCTGIFYSHTFSFIDDDQAKSRLHRRGQRKKVRLFLIYAENTIDEVIHDALRRKRRLTGRVLINLTGDVLWQRKPTRRSSSTKSLTWRRSSTSRKHRCGSRFGSTTSRRPANSTAGTRRTSLTRW
ncbi:MAG: DEAD/DEAH box helicase [Phycisphaerales bacterium]